MIDPWTLYQAGKFGYNAAKWLTEPVARELTLINHFHKEKKVYAAVCVYTDAGSVSAGWIRVDPGDSESVRIPVPRVFGNTWVAIYARTRKGKYTFAGSGGEGRLFHVAVPGYSGRLESGASFTIQDCATNHPRMVMNQFGVDKLAQVSGQLISMTGDFKFTYQ